MMVIIKDIIYMHTGIIYEKENNDRFRNETGGNQNVSACQ